MSKDTSSPPKDSESEKTKKLSKSQARVALKRVQTYIGIVFFLSALSGAYLLATDQSVWRLALSHAIGLIFISAVDVVIGVLSLRAVRQVYLPGMLWAFLAVLLQLGDIVTAPQYKMTMGYFASYLFSLWAFDALLVGQVIVIAISLYGRTYVRTLTKKRVTYFDMGVSSSRRDFLQIMGSIGILVALAGALGVAKVLTPSPAQQTTTPGGLPVGAIANVNNLQPGIPTYFQYPQGDPNVLLKKADGSLTALSMLCTHVCCECSYNGAQKLIECPCHGSVFDASGKVLAGPAAFPLPTVEISVDSNGYVFPKGVSGSSPCLQA